MLEEDSSEETDSPCERISHTLETLKGYKSTFDANLLEGTRAANQMRASLQSIKRARELLQLSKEQRLRDEEKLFEERLAKLNADKTPLFRQSLQSLFDSIKPNQKKPPVSDLARLFNSYGLGYDMGRLYDAMLGIKNTSDITETRQAIKSALSSSDEEMKSFFRANLKKKLAEESRQYQQKLSLDESDWAADLYAIHMDHNEDCTSHCSKLDLSSTERAQLKEFARWYEQAIKIRNRLFQVPPELEEKLKKAQDDFDQNRCAERFTGV